MKEAKSGLYGWIGVVTTLAVIGAALWYTAAQPGSWYDSTLIYVYEKQRGFTQAFGSGVSAVSNASDMGPLISLIGLGFAYGIFHAVGPGHGKAIITAYAATHETNMKRVAGIAFASALVQGITAIVAVLGIAFLVEGSLRRAALAANDYLDPLSYAAITLVGVYLAWHGASRFYRSIQAARLAASHTQKHGHHHDNDHQHDHGDDACCGHSHTPDVKQVAQADTLWKAALVAVSVGLRPCSGAILVLVLTFSVGVLGSGVAAVIAMSLGTGITVATIALSAQGIRWPLTRLLENANAPMVSIGAGTSLLGGGIIIAVGAGLLQASLSTAAHPLF